MASWDNKGIKGSDLQANYKKFGDEIKKRGLGEVIAEALVDVDARLGTLESADPDRLSNAIADSLDAQTLKYGGVLVKTQQAAKTSPSASGTDIAFIDTITQNANGEITATKKTVRSATTSQTGVVQLQDSLSDGVTNKAPTVNAVYDAVSAKQDSLTWITDDEIDVLWANAKSSVLAE